VAHQFLRSAPTRVNYPPPRSRPSRRRDEPDVDDLFDGLLTAIRRGHADEARRIEAALLRRGWRAESPPGACGIRLVSTDPAPARTMAPIETAAALVGLSFFEVRRLVDDALVRSERIHGLTYDVLEDLDVALAAEGGDS
jgi:hypothetical protein